MTMILRPCLIVYSIIVLFQLEPQAQCYPDRHNTGVSTSWVSCEISGNPNAERAAGHWIMYNLDATQALSDMKIWNLNHPKLLTSGVSKLAIDYIDGGIWKEFTILDIDQAGSSSFYEGQDIEFSEDLVSNQVLLTILDNHGGECAGFSEVRFGITEKTTAVEDISDDHFAISISPNPFNQYTSIEIEQIEGQNINYEVSNNLGQIIERKTLDTNGGTVAFNLNAENLPSGNYFLKIIDGKRVSVRKLTHQIN